jgi:hypothetical protein
MKGKYVIEEADPTPEETNDRFSEYVKMREGMLRRPLTETEIKELRRIRKSKERRMLSDGVFYERIF